MGRNSKNERYKMIQTTLDFGMTEAEKKAFVLDAIENNFPKFLETVRKWGRHFCYSNKGFMKYGLINAITTDDVRNHFNIPTKSNGDNNIMGSVFRVGFAKSGEWYASKVEGSHGRPILVWQCFPKGGK